MPVPLAALFSAAIYLERSSVAEPEDIARTITLLHHAARGEALCFEVRGDDLLINGTPLSLEAPGAAVIRHALVDHHTARLELPGSLAPTQWHGVIELYASAPGLYLTVDDLRDALRFSVPEAVVYGTIGAAAEGDLRQSLFELPGLRAGASPASLARAVSSQDNAIAELERQLDPILQAAEAARARRDYPALAQLLWQLQELAEAKSTDHRAIIVRERRRIVSGDDLETMARLIPKSGPAGIVARVLGVMGHDGAAALLNALNGAQGPHERRVYIDALVASRDADTTIVEALRSERTDLVRDAAEVVGRKRMEQAVPVLAHLLRHSKVDVRTTAWHALELIGTREAIKALRT